MSLFYAVQTLPCGLLIKDLAQFQGYKPQGQDQLNQRKKAQITWATWSLFCLHN